MFDNNYDFYSDEIITVTYNIKRIQNNGNVFNLSGIIKLRGRHVGRYKNLCFCHKLSIPIHTKW
jgi:hypothetical protein